MKKIILLLLIAALPVALFYGWFELRSDHIAQQNKLPDSYANALKHSDAAGMVYGCLRMLQLKPTTAENLVISLGKLNEEVELLVKSKKDNTLEMMKDHHNNFTGIVVTQWMEEKKSTQVRSDILIKLARDKILLVAREDVPIPADQKLEARTTASPQMAAQWFAQEKESIRQKITNSLE